MRKIVVLFVVLVIAFAFVVPVSAGRNGTGNGNGTGGTGSGTGQGQQGGRGTFALVGKITAIGTDTVTIDVLRGNKLVQPFVGTQVTVTVTPRTRYLYKDGTTTRVIGFADLQVGQAVSINGTLANNIWTASRITVGASLSCFP